MTRGQPQCAGVGQAVCDEAVEAGDIKLTSLKQEECGLNWELETENHKVVLIVSQTSAMRERLTQNIAVLTVMVTRTLRRLRQSHHPRGLSYPKSKFGMQNSYLRDSDPMGTDISM